MIAYLQLNKQIRYVEESVFIFLINIEPYDPRNNLNTTFVYLINTKVGGKQASISIQYETNNLEN